MVAKREVEQLEPISEDSLDEGQGYIIELREERTVFAGDYEDLLTVSESILLGSLRDGRLRVYEPINVKFIVEGPHVIAECEEFNEFGFGENWPGALSDLQGAIAELYLTLESEEGRLGPDLEAVWASLQSKIKRIDK